MPTGRVFRDVTSVVIQPDSLANAPPEQPGVIAVPTATTGPGIASGIIGNGLTTAGLSKSQLPASGMAATALTAANLLGNAKAMAALDSSVVLLDKKIGVAAITPTKATEPHRRLENAQAEAARS